MEFNLELFPMTIPPFQFAKIWADSDASNSDAFELQSNLMRACDLRLYAHQSVRSPTLLHLIHLVSQHWSIALLYHATIREVSDSLKRSFLLPVLPDLWVSDPERINQLHIGCNSRRHWACKVSSLSSRKSSRRSSEASHDLFRTIFIFRDPCNCICVTFVSLPCKVIIKDMHGNKLQHVFAPTVHKYCSCFHSSKYILLAILK